MTLSPTLTNPTVDYRRKRRRRTSQETQFALAFGFAVAAPTALYLATGAPLEWHTAGDIVTGLGILTGLIATQMVLIMLLLAARIPWVDQTIGLDRAISLHNQLGKPSFYGLQAHGLLITVGYGLSEGVDPVTETMSLLGIGDMVWAYVSMALFVLVVVSSLVVVKRKLPREFWMGVHFLSYAAVASSIPHQFSMGSVLASGTISRWYWITAYLLTASATLVFRIALPLVRSFQASLRVSDVTVSSWRALPSGDSVPDSWTVTMTGPGVRSLEAESRQFFRWRFLTPQLWWQQHPISLSAAPTGDSLRFTVRNLGSAAIGSVKTGTRVFFAGPYGLFTEAARTQPKLVLAGAGAGIDPIRSLVETADFAPGECTVIIRASDEDSLILRDEIREWCWNRGAVLFELVGHRAQASDRYSLSLERAAKLDRASWLPADHALAGYTLENYAPHLSQSDVYVCGPSAWTDAVLADAQTAGLKQESLHSTTSSTGSSSSSSSSTKTRNSGSSSSTDTSDSSTGSSSSGTSSSSGSTSGSSSGSSSASDGTFKGTAYSTRWGDVQVSVTIADGKITDVTTLAAPDNDGRSMMISQRAIPTLRSEVLSAQSADVQSVSGATYTSAGYLSSLQSALDKANF